MTWYASRPGNMDKNREFLKKYFQIEVVYPPSEFPNEKKPEKKRDQPEVEV